MQRIMPITYCIDLIVFFKIKKDFNALKGHTNQTLRAFLVQFINHTMRNHLLAKKDMLNLIFTK